MQVLPVNCCRWIPERRWMDWNSSRNEESATSVSVGYVCSPDVVNCSNFEPHQPPPLLLLLALKNILKSSRFLWWGIFARNGALKDFCCSVRETSIYQMQLQKKTEKEYTVLWFFQDAITNMLADWNFPLKVSCGRFSYTKSYFTKLVF